MKGDLGDWIAILLGLLLIIGVATLVIVGITAHIDLQPETGMHTGYITESGFGGLFWKTHYAKVISAQVALEQAGASDSWEYGFMEGNFNQTLWSDIQEYQHNNTKINVQYYCQLIVYAWQANDACIITSVSPT
jgi:hypothetical protein